MSTARKDAAPGAPTDKLNDLRGTLEWLRDEGDLVVTDKEVDPDLEIIALQKRFDGGCPILFNNIKGKPNHRVVTNLLSDQTVINKMFGWPDNVTRTRMTADALRHPLPPMTIDQKHAPCQEVVIEKPTDVNDYLVPVRHTDFEPELTVGSGIRCVTGDYFEGGADLGYNRMNFRWGNVGTFQISPGSHMWQVVSRYYKADAPIPITICFGVPPSCTMLAGAGFDYVILPEGCDEIAVAGALQGSPVRMVNARTVEALALADALRTNTALRFLNLEANNLGTEGGLALAVGMSVGVGCLAKRKMAELTDAAEARAGREAEPEPEPEPAARP